MHWRALLLVMVTGLLSGEQPGWVVSQDRLASEVGAQVLAEGGTAVDAAVATAFALAVTHPAAGNLGGGGFLLSREAGGVARFYDFRETAPAAARPDMFLRDGVYDEARHHDSYLAAGVPGTVAGLHAAWKAQGHLPWKRLLEPAVRLAAQGFPVSPRLAQSLAEILPAMATYPASMAQFSVAGRPYQAGEILRQPDLARSLERIARSGPRGFYQGKTARLLIADLQAHGSIMTRQDLAGYRCVEREPLRGSYRGIEVLAAPPPSSGGVVLLEALNILEGYRLADPAGPSAGSIHRVAEAMRRAYADRAQFLGDPGWNPELPLARLLSKGYAAELRAGIDPAKASISSPNTFSWGHESPETTHLSVLDRAGNAVSLTYTLEASYGSCRVVPGAGFLLNNEMGDFNAGPGLTDASGRIGTAANLAAPGKRMLSSMAPTILVKDGRVFMVTGSPGGRTIPNTVLWTILQVLEFGQDAAGAVAAPRYHHQWLPDRLGYEKGRLSPELAAQLRALGHTLEERASQGCAQVILVDGHGHATGAADSRWADSAAVTEHH